ncbi:MAG: DUF3108 domain-containing protein [Pseudomonadota bacterium]
MTSAVAPTATRADTTPWARLSALTVAVMLAHALVLNGGLPTFQDTGLPGELADASEAVADRQTPAADAPSAESTAPARPRPVTRSQVRWIELAPPPPPEPPPPAPVKRRPPPPPPAPAPVPAPEPVAEVPVPDLTPAAGIPSDLGPEMAQAPSADTLPVPDTGTPALATKEPATTPAVAMAPEAPLPGDPALVLPPAQLPPAGTLRYQVSGQAKGFSYHAKGSLRWQHGAGRYEASFGVSAFLVGSREQLSQGRVDDQGLHPERFSDRSRRERTAELDAAAGRIRYTHGGERPLQRGTQDRLSVALQLGALLNARPQAYPPGSTIRLPVTDTSQVEFWEFVVGPEEKLAIVSGELPVIGLTRQPRRPGDRKVEMWLAPTLSYLPARLRVSEANGDHIDQLLEAKD